MSASRAALLVLALLLVPSRGSGSIVPPPSFDELVGQAEAIFIGTVVDSRPRWVSTPRGDVIATAVTFEVQETLKGTLSLQVQLELLGGTIGDTTFGVPGVPVFTVGEQVLLFAYTTGLHVSPIVGVMHGRFRIGIHPETGERYVTTHDGRAFSSVRQLGGRIPAISREPIRTMRLEEFRAEIARRTGRVSR